jgi:hypothetical protein
VESKNKLGIHKAFGFNITICKFDLLSSSPFRFVIFTDLNLYLTSSFFCIKKVLSLLRIVHAET